MTMEVKTVHGEHKYVEQYTVYTMPHGVAECIKIFVAEWIRI